MEGMQEEFGEIRVFDTGIREASIIGQGIGLALRGLRPIAEIQYLDYLLYAIQIMSDDISTLAYRTKGSQKCPLIIRTRGHRLEGVWHARSPMGGIINLVRGMIVCVPRNMLKAANTLASSRFCLIMFSGSFFHLGKSSSTKTTLSSGHFLNSGKLKTSLFNLMHQPHQSLPVKKSRRGLFS